MRQESNDRLRQELRANSLLLEEVSRKNREVMAANTFLQAELHVAESKLVKQEQQMQQQLTGILQDQLYRLKAQPNPSTPLTDNHPSLYTLL